MTRPNLEHALAVLPLEHVLRIARALADAPIIVEEFDNEAEFTWEPVFDQDAPTIAPGEDAVTIAPGAPR